MSLGYYARTQKGTKRKWKILLFFWKVPNTLQGRLSPVRNQCKLCKGAEPQVLHDEAFRMLLVADKSSQATRFLFLSGSLISGLCHQHFLTHIPEERAKEVCQAFVPSLQDIPSQPPTLNRLVPTSLAALATIRKVTGCTQWVWTGLGARDLGSW